MITKVIKYNKTVVAKTIPSAKMYIERFMTLQNTLQQQNKKIHQLSKQIQLAQRASKMTTRDHLNKAISKIFGNNFQSRAMKSLRQQLIFNRQDLQTKIQQSDTKWEKPRQQIIKLRKQISDQFLAQFVKLEENLLKNCSYQTTPELAEGLALIHRLLITTITKHGVTFYEPEVGTAFDPELYDTVDKGEKGKPIVKIASRGWKINNKIVKKSIVHLE